MPATKTVYLDTPIKRGDTEITEFTVREPAGGELRGLSLLQIQMGMVDAHITLIPRIATPMITEADVAAMPSGDLTEAVDAVVGFFMTRANRAPVRNRSTKSSRTSRASSAGQKSRSTSSAAKNS